MRKILLGVTMLLFSVFSMNAQTNIAPQATFTDSYMSAGYGPGKLNNLIFGTCGTQEMWLRTATPPSSTVGVEWIQWEFTSSKQIDEIIFHHGQTNGRYMNGATLQYWNGGWVTAHQFSNLTLQCINSVKFNRIKSTKFRLTAFKVDAGGQQSNINFREFEIIESPEFNFDAGVSGLLKPGIPVCSGLSNAVTAVVTNFGTKDLDSCIVNWKVNDSLQVPLKFNKLLKPNQFDSISLTYFQTFSFGDTVEFWTSMPNGVLDSNDVNDSLYNELIAGLKGTYAVGGPGSPDYSTLDSAIMDLNKRGVCANVTFELYDTTHMANTPIYSFYSSSPTRVVTFKSKGGDKTLCSIYDVSTNSVNNYALQFKGGSNIVVKNLSITNASNGSYSGVISLEQNSGNITFDNCNISSKYSGGSTNACLVYSGPKDRVSGISFNNCEFEGGSWAAHLEGDKGALHSNINFTKSKFKNNNRSSIWLMYVDGSKISQNTMESNSKFAGVAAIRVDETAGYVEIYGNYIKRQAVWPAYGALVKNSSGTSNKQNLFSTNSFSIGDTLSAPGEAKRGIALDNVGFFNVVSNSVSMKSNNINSNAFMVINSSGNTILNNVFANMSATGNAVLVSGLGSVLKMDKNLLYSLGNIGTFSGSNQQSLSSWQSNTGFDANSVSDNPIFRSDNDLKMCSKLADNIGQSFGLVVDFDGNLRDPKSPDPGAFEYSAISGLNVADQRVCKGDTASFFVAKGANDIVIWNHQDSSQTFNTTSVGTYSLTALGVCGADTALFNVINNDLIKLGNDTNICGGDTLISMASLSNASYSWNNGMSTRSIGIKSNGRYIVNVVDSDACVSADTIEVTVSKSVALRSDTSICLGKTVELDPGTPGGSYTWFRNGISFSTATKIFADSAGKYSVLYLDAKSCSSSDTFDLTVISIPSAKFTWTQNQNNVNFIADDKTGSNYFWAFGDGKTISGPAWNTLNKYVANKVYNVTLTVSSAFCGDSTLVDQVNLETIGMNELLNSNGLRVYPNPSGGLVNLEIPSDLVTETLNVKVTAADGKVVFVKNGLNSGSKYEIDLRDNVSTGIYMIHVYSKNNIIYSSKISIK